MKSHQIVRAGVGRTFQTATVFEELTRPAEPRHRRRCAPHGALACCGRVAGFRRTSKRRSRRSASADLKDRPAGVLAHGQKQWLEIGMLLVQDAKVMLLDEPVAGMSAEEREETGELLRRIGTERTIVVIEHDMDFVRTLRRRRDRHARGQGADRGHRRRDPGQPAGPGGLPGPDRRRGDACLSSRASPPATAARWCWSDVDVDVPAGWRGRRHGPQRRRQDHPAARRRGPAAGEGRDRAPRRTRTSPSCGRAPVCARASATSRRVSSASRR